MLAWKLCSAVAAVALLAAVTARADDAPKVIVVGSAQAEAGSGEGPGLFTMHGQGVYTMRSEYWLGVFASRPSPALRAQLKLPKDQGLVVDALQPESPAAKAGIQQYDILLKGNDKPLADLRDLLQLIDQVKDGNLDLELLRAGKREIVTVTPTKRPANEAGEMGELWIDKPAVSTFRGFGPNMGPSLAEGGPLEFHIVHPGQILPPGGPMVALPGGGSTTMEIIVHATSKLADGSKVEITRHDAEPVQVVVTHDKDKWEGTSSDLSKIPEKIRPEVEKLLHPTFDHMRALATTDELAGGNVTYFSGAIDPHGLPGALAGPPGLEKRLVEMQKQIDELRKSVDALKGKDR